MLQDFRLLQCYLTGKLDDSKDLKKGMKVLLFVSLISWIFSAYNAFMSQSFYGDQFGTFIFATEASWIVTITISLGILFLSGYVIDYALDWLDKGKSGVEDRSLNMFLSSLLLLIILITWDLVVNLGGIDPVSRNTTAPIKDDKSSSVSTSYDEELLKSKISLAANYNTYFWCAKHRKRHKKHDYRLTNNPNLQDLDIPPSVCSKENFWFACGSSNGVKCSDHNVTKEAIAEAEKNISNITSNKSVAVASALADYTADKDRYSKSVEDKANTHNNLVWVSYLIIIICVVNKSNTANRAFDYIYENYPHLDPRYNIEPEPIKKTKPLVNKEKKSKKKNKKKKRNILSTSSEDATNPNLAIAGAGLDIDSEEVVTDPSKNRVGGSLPPDNTGKKYITKNNKDTSSTNKKSDNKRLERKEILALLTQYRIDFPKHKATKAVDYFGNLGESEFYISKSSVYTYWKYAI